MTNAEWLKAAEELESAEGVVPTDDARWAARCIRALDAELRANQERDAAATAAIEAADKMNKLLEDSIYGFESHTKVGEALEATWRQERRIVQDAYRTARTAWGKTKGE